MRRCPVTLAAHLRSDFAEFGFQVEGLRQVGIHSEKIWAIVQLHMLHVDQTVNWIAQFALEPSRNPSYGWEMGGRMQGEMFHQRSHMPSYQPMVVPVSTNDLPMETCYLSIWYPLGDISNIRTCMHYLLSAQYRVRLRSGFHNVSIHLRAFLANC